MRKALFLICAAALVLSGCVKSDTTLTFNEDKTIDMTVIYSIERNAGAADEAIESILEGAGEQLDEAEITYETGKSETAYTLTVPLRFDSVEEMTESKYFNSLTLIPRFGSDSGEGKLYIELAEGGDLKIEGVMNAATLGFDAFISQAGIEPERMEARLALVLPDGTAEEWSVNGSGEAEISFAAKNIYGEAGGEYNSYIVIAIAAALVIAAAIIIVPKKRKEKEEL